MKTLALVAQSLHPMGGVAQWTRWLADYLVRQGYRVIVFVAEQAPNSAEVSAMVIPLPERDYRRSSVDAFFIAGKVRAEHVSVLIVCDWMKYLHKIRKYTVCKIVYVDHGMPFAGARVSLSNRNRKARRNLWRGCEWALFYYWRDVVLGKRMSWARQRTRNVLCLSDRYVTLCDAYREEIVAALGIADTPEAKRMRVIPNAQEKPKKLHLDKAKQIIYVGRLTTGDKRVDRLIELWRGVYRELPDWEFVVVGEGKYRRSMERASRGLERIKFVGYQPDVQPYYDAGSIQVLVSDFDCRPLCLTEAQANGVVPIAFECSAGVREVLAPSGENGVLVTPGDMATFCRELIALARDEGRLTAMRENVVRKAADYDPMAIGKKWENLLQEL